MAESGSRFVLHSTKESIEANLISLAACLEILWSIFFHWLIWFYFNTYFHIVAALIIAPLLLLRSRESTQEGRDLVTERDSLFKPEIKFRALAGLLLLTGFLLTAVVFEFMQIEYFPIARYGFIIITLVLCFATAAAIAVEGFTAGFEEAGLAVLLGALGAIAFYFAKGGLWFLLSSLLITITSFFAFLVLSAIITVYFGESKDNTRKAISNPKRYIRGRKLLLLLSSITFLMFLWIGTLVIRFYATILHLPDGIKCLANNWYQSMFCIDPWHPPSFLPGVERLSAEHIGEILRSGDESKKDKKISFYAALPLVYIPALLYRWGIKSTFWFYWPLVYVATEKKINVTRMAVLSSTLIGHPRERARLWLAFATLFLTLVATISKDSFINMYSSNPAMIFPYLLVIDFTNVKPWQWLQLSTAFLTVVIWMKAWTTSIESEVYLKHGENYEWTSIGIISVLLRVRNITTWSYLAVGLLFTLLYWETTSKYVPRTIINYVEYIFQSEMPIRF